MELFDLVDEQGNPTGEITDRTTAHAQGLRHRTAHIWVIRRNSGSIQVLLQKRAQNKDSFPGKFDTSSAGHIQAGDAPLPSALRELEEELGIRAAPEELQFAGIFRIQYEKNFYGKLFRDNEVSFVYVYEKPVELSQLTLQAEEVESVAWFPLTEVQSALQCHDPRFCVPPDGLSTLIRYLAHSPEPT